MAGAQGYATYRNLNLGATGALVAVGPRVIGGWWIYNNAAAARYVKLYNKAVAPTVGTDVPLITLGVPASSAANLMIPNSGGGQQGIGGFDSGIGIGATTGVADADTGAPSANDIVLNLWYL